jgi:rhodanese-related sulfurtransferase
LQYLAPDAKIPRVTKEELKLMLDRPDVIIVDVRVEEEWKKSEWKIKGAVREDPEKDIQSWVGRYPKGKTLVFY